MQEMEAIQRIVGPVDETEIVTSMAMIVQATLFLFFVVSPLMGAILWRSIASRVNFVLAWSTAVVATLLGNYVLNELLTGAIPEERLPEELRLLLVGIISIVSGLLLARYIAFVTEDPGAAAWVLEHDALEDDELMPFERKRKAWMQRRDRSQHRS